MASLQNDFLDFLGLFTQPHPLLDTLQQEGAKIWLEQAIQIQRSGVQRRKMMWSMHEELPFTPIKIGKQPVCGFPEERR